MSDLIGTFQSKRWGPVNVFRATYESPTGPTAVVLESDNGEPLTKLSLNLYRPECSHDSKDLPKDCFYAKEYGENEDLAPEAMASGLFKLRDDLPRGASGFITCPVWEIAS